MIFCFSQRRKDAKEWIPVSRGDAGKVGGKSSKVADSVKEIFTGNLKDWIVSGIFNR